MKALSLRPEWAMPVLLGWKTVECRTWQTDYRGPLLVCSSSKPRAGCIAGHALCVSRLVGIHPFGPDDMEPAMMEGEAPEGAYAWELGDRDWVEPFPVKGRLHLFDVPDELVRVIPESVPCDDALRSYYEPLVRFWGRGVSEAGVREWWDGVVSDFAGL